MKKALGEVISQPTTGELEARIAKLEALVEQHHPTPKLETLQPYPVGTEVYSLQDLEGRNPFTVVGYLGRRILVRLSPGEPERSLPIGSVRPLKECPRAQPSPSQAFAGISDPKAREFFEGRRKAQIDAATKPFTPPIPHQERYGKTGTFVGGRLVYDD